MDLEGVLVSLDPDRLQRVIINLIENTCHAMFDEVSQKFHSDACLKITTRENNDRFEISIADTGVGIPEHILPKIYEPLFSTKTFGVGLGMPIVKQIMQ